MMVPPLYNPRYSSYQPYSAFSEGFVYECPYHPGGPIAITTHRGYLNALGATVSCTHDGCHFSAYEDGIVSSQSQCPTAREERAKDGPGDLKLGVRMPFHCLIHRRKWFPHEADATGRVDIRAEVSPVVERNPSAPVQPSKSPSIPQAGAPAATTNVINEPPDENRGSCCFGNGIKGGWKKVQQTKGQEGSPPKQVLSMVDDSMTKFVLQNVIPPSRDDEAPAIKPFEILVNSPRSSDDDYVNVPRVQEKANVPRRWQTLRNIHYRDSVYDKANGAQPGGPNDRLPPKIYPGRVHKSTQLRDPKDFTPYVKSSDLEDNKTTVHHINAERGKSPHQPPPSIRSETPSDDTTEDLSAESIANLVLRLAEIPDRLTTLEKTNEATARSLDAKNKKIQHLEECIERAKLREQDLEDIISIYEQAGRRRQVSSLT
ncbi:hypothetical protein CVT24_004852 [Panaeolus cyanescens]|uniref:Uncharacterized protein n=1 Tax=Panaeolus cyanescens TaxID=181874 RepID=A0A409VQ82_9AGAR|nr:hypothetical protein CVT24_004852 [Panaeolus cyanescens]